MAATAMKYSIGNSIRHIFRFLKLERQEVTSIYFYAILSGLIQLSLPLGIQYIINYVMGGAISASLIILVVLVVGGVFVSGLLQVNQMKIIEKIQQQVFVRYSFEFAWRIPRFDLSSTDNYYLPELVNRFFDVVSLQKAISKLLLDIPTAFIQITFGLLLLSFYHPVFIIFGVMLVILLFIILFYSGSAGLATSIRESNHKYKVAAWLEEVARVVGSVKFARSSEMPLRKTDAEVSEYLDARTSHFKILIFQYWSLIGFKIVVTAAMLIVGSFLLIRQQLNIGQFIAAEIVIITILSAVEKLIISLDTLYDVMTSFEKLNKITETPLETEGNAILTPGKSPALLVQQLSFAYPDGKTILDNISFSAEPGEKICVMGADGSGKSTLLRILSGSLHGFTGTLLINGIAAASYELASLRKATGVLHSDFDIFQGSLLDNITMGNTSTSYEAILQMAEKTGLGAWMREQPAGLDTELDPTGRRLPRNVVQKILLLRALINSPQLLLLEERWQHFDETYRTAIEQHLFQETGNATMVIVSNDARIASRCDKVIYLSSGKITASGNWQQIQSQIN
jgi:ATP-binding cassette, subfamily B, bacterial